MNDREVRDWMRKLSRNVDTAPDARDEALLDELLKSEPQLAMAHAVRQLPEDEPSLVWRSETNHKILEAGIRQRQPRSPWVWRSALGLGLAGALAAVTLLSGPATIPSAAEPHDVEARIMRAHREALNARLVADRGLLVQESKPTLSTAWREFQWQEADLGL